MYRDTAAWCPYCEKVWLALEEKRVPYAIEKVNMNCYGEKPEWFWQMQPSGGIPVAKVDGQVVRESNDIMMAIEGLYADQRPMLPAADDPRSASKAACYFVGVPAAASEAESHAARFECAPNGRLTKKAWVATNGAYACDEAPSWSSPGRRESTASAHTRRASSPPPRI